MDQITIKPDSNVGLYGSLTTVVDEYLSSSLINITNEIQQIGDNQEIYAQYNMYYFNLTSEEGAQCYKNWVLGNSIPDQSECPSITNLQQIACHNYSNCFN